MVSEIIAEQTWIGVLLGLGRLLLSVVLVIVVSQVAIRIVDASINKVFRKKGMMFKKTEETRLNTLRTIITSAVHYLILFVAGIMILEQLGLETGSLIAAAGIGGLAIGFGAQNLVRDLVTGFFILLEDHYDIGDFVTVSGISGVVEEMGIRVTRVRDFGGELHIIPNGQITQVTNHMGAAMRVMIDVDIAYEVDVDRAISVLEELFTQLNELNPEMAANVVDGPRVLGVDALAASGVTLKVWARAATMTQWAVTRDLRKLIKQAFDREGIEIPYPRRYLVFDKKSYQQTP